MVRNKEVADMGKHLIIDAAMKQAWPAVRVGCFQYKVNVEKDGRKAAKQAALRQSFFYASRDENRMAVKNVGVLGKQRGNHKNKK